MGERLLTVENLKSHFFLASGTVKAVDGVSFTLDKGEVLGIVGESGCGKSVTASSIIRLLPPKVGRIVDGSIRFEDRDVLSFSQKQLRDFRGRDISTIFQNPMTSLDPVFKIGNQMVEMIRAHHKEIDRNRALEISIDACAGWESPTRKSGSAATPTSCQAVCASASSSPWPCAARQSSLSPTSPPPRWMSPSSPRC